MKLSRLFSLFIFACFTSPLSAEENRIESGDKLQLLSNLHPDENRRLLYTLNYQQGGLIRACEEVTVVRVTRKKMNFDYQGVTYEIAYEGHSKKAGISFQEALHTFFGKSCDTEKMASLSDIDREGIRRGIAKLGMSKDGVLFAMGRPPYHATPRLDSDYWLYWRNRYGKRGIEFDSDGRVSGIR